MLLIMLLIKKIYYLLFRKFNIKSINFLQLEMKTSLMNHVNVFILIII